jgi:hypothetical protein
LYVQLIASVSNHRRHPTVLPIPSHFERHARQRAPLRTEFPDRPLHFSENVSARIGFSAISFSQIAISIASSDFKTKPVPPHRR